MMEKEQLELDENLLLATYIQMARTYDAIMTLIALTDKDAAENLTNIHEKGELIGPLPALSGDDDESEDS